MRKRDSSVLGFSLLAPLLSLNLYALPLEAASVDMSRCESLGPVTANSGYGKNPGWYEIAKRYAIKRAENLGATHVVIRSSRNIGTFNGEVTFEAFHCGLKNS